MRPDDESPEPAPLDDEERAFRESLEKVVDWVRVEPSRLFLRAFAPALALVPAGGALVATSVSSAVPATRQGVLFLLLGLLLITCGPLWALFALIRSMGRDAYVAIRKDGLAVRLDPDRPQAVYAWESIEDARPEPEHRVRVSLATGETLLLVGPFADVSENDLARRIRDAKRLALWHRLTPEALHVR